MSYRVTPESAAAGIVDPPVSTAADAVVLGAIGLNAGKAALWARTACVQPFSIGVEHILDIVFTRLDVVVRPEYVTNVIPCLALDPDQIEITVEVAVA